MTALGTDSRATAARAPGGRRRGLRWLRRLLLALVGLLVLAAGAVGVGYALTDIPPANALTTRQATVIRYADGAEIARLGTNRELVALSQVSGPAQKAVLAAEDRGFYEEPGISPRGIARALLTNVRGGGEVQQGGSTITQQYAKNAFLLGEDGTADRTYGRKVKEVFLALKMTRQRSKDEILEDYLNSIYFGRGAWGIEAASKAYFGRRATAATLTAEQGAVLASSIRSPAGYEPSEHPERARARFAYVLDGMVQQGWLAPAERAAAVYPEVVAPGQGRSGTDLSGPDGHVVAAVTDELRVAGFSEQELDEGGLVVTTTLRQRAQDAAVRSVQEVADDTTGEGLQGALVAVAPGTGEVIAYYGGANGTGLDYAGGVVRARGEDYVRQEPGSSFKPYVLAAALDQGIPLTRRYDGNSPKQFEGVPRPIRNFDDTSYGRVSLTRATRNSVNTAYVELGLEVGLDRVAETAHAAGIPRDVPLAEPSGEPVPSISLGVYGVHVTDQAVGYATFANGGEAVTPYLVRSVERGGEQVHEGTTTRTRAFGEDVAADATYALQQVVDRGTGTRAQLDDGRPAAGKTGTTTGAKDVWFAGYTPQLAAAVWFGYGTPRTVEVDGEDATGGRVSSAVWKDFMDATLEGAEEEDFPPRAFVDGDDEGSDDEGTDEGNDGGDTGGDSDGDTGGDTDGDTGGDTDGDTGGTEGGSSDSGDDTGTGTDLPSDPTTDTGTGPGTGGDATQDPAPGDGTTGSGDEPTAGPGPAQSSAPTGDDPAGTPLEPPAGPDTPVGPDGPAVPTREPATPAVPELDTATPPAA